MYANDYAKARDYYRLDAGSGYQKRREAMLRLREGHLDEVRKLPPQAETGDWAALFSDASPARDRAVAEAEQVGLRDRDPESRYTYACLLARAGYPDSALRVLRSAVEGNYLAVPAMDADPLFDSIRNRPEFAAIREEAVRRQKEFLAKRAAPAA
jgi:hypothetical protein